MQSVGVVCIIAIEYVIHKHQLNGCLCITYSMAIIYTTPTDLIAYSKYLVQVRLSLSIVYEGLEPTFHSLEKYFVSSESWVIRSKFMNMNVQFIPNVNVD